ncbi:MAG: hypothetical protein KZQ58_05875 [gamma proteobacterium symbiont of Bathyaustriella thionipta]|nr:hypothetical protein [gamma proteobacterium symbiont of Bathyaustriella thionipta]
MPAAFSVVHLELGKNLQAVPLFNKEGLGVIGNVWIFVGNQELAKLVESPLDFPFPKGGSKEQKISQSRQLENQAINKGFC